MKLFLLILELLLRLVGLGCLVAFLITWTHSGATIESLHLLVIGLALRPTPNADERRAK